MNERKYHSIPEAATIMGCSEASLRVWILKGMVTATQFGARQYVSDDEVSRYIAQGPRTTSMTRLRHDAVRSGVYEGVDRSGRVPASDWDGLD